MNKIINIEAYNEENWENKEKKTLKKDYFKRLFYFNGIGDTNNACDLMIEVQDFLIEKGILTDDLLMEKGANIKDKEQQLVKNIFLSIRKECQDDNEPCEDFSYYGVAIQWLRVHGVKVNI